MVRLKKKREMLIRQLMECQRPAIKARIQDEIKTVDTEIERLKAVPEGYTVSYKGNDTIAKTYGPFSTLREAVSYAEGQLRDDPYVDEIRIARVKE